MVPDFFAICSFSNDHFLVVRKEKDQESNTKPCALLAFLLPPPPSPEQAFPVFYKRSAMHKKVGGGGQFANYIVWLF